MQKELNKIARDTNFFLKNLFRNKKIRTNNSYEVWTISRGQED